MDMNFKIWLEEEDSGDQQEIDAAKTRLGAEVAAKVQNADGAINPQQTFNLAVSKEMKSSGKPGKVAALTPIPGGVKSPVNAMKKKSKKK